MVARLRRSGSVLVGPSMSQVKMELSHSPVVLRANSLLEAPQLSSSPVGLLSRPEGLMAVSCSSRPAVTESTLAVERNSRLTTGRRSLCRQPTSALQAQVQALRQRDLQR